MRVVILSSLLQNSASYYLTYLAENKDCEIAMVIYNEGTFINDKKKLFKNTVQKAFKIGLLGALNGIRMRKWYKGDVQKYLKVPDLDQICKEYNIPFYKVESINSDLTRELFRKADADLGISLANTYIVPSVFKIPKYGMINIHHEVLPKYQNAQSVIWQLYNGSVYTGYTIHKIADKVDSGNILFQETIPIQFEQTLGETVAKTYSLLWEKSAQGLMYVQKNFIELEKNSISQTHNPSYTTPTIWEFLVMYFNFRRLKRKEQKLKRKLN